MADEKNLETPKTDADQAATPAAAPTPSASELEAKIAALSAQLEKQKRATDNAASDAASWKAKFRETQSEAERAEAERAENEKRLLEENAALKRDKVISAYSNRALALGYDADLAQATAEAMANGDMDAVFAGIGQLVQTVKTKTVAESFSRQPELSTGAPPSTNTVAEEENEKFRHWMGLPPTKRK